MRILVIRLGAIGDMIGITPLLRYLKQQGSEVYVLTKKTGVDILANNPNVDKVIAYNDELRTMYPDPNINEVPDHELGKFFKAIEKAYECDKAINLCESWEVKLARCPHEPNFKYPKQWALENCDINYYEQIFKLAEIDVEGVCLNPEMFFTESEEIEMHNFFIDLRKKGKYVIMWGLSGSAANKTYPYVPEVIFPILEKYPQVCFLTVGDEACQILEVELKHERIVNKSGLWTIRQSALACKFADLVIAPDTGLLHASGMWPTPKIGLLNHTSRNNIVKWFQNDYSLHASVEGRHPLFGPITCSPCFKIHQHKRITCNMAEVKHTQVPVCMAYGIPPERVIARIEEVLNEKANSVKS